MTETELFQIIDEGIDIFKKSEGYQKGIKVNKRPHSDWLVFNWRQLTWRDNGLDYLMEVYPNFDKQENILSWTFYSAVGYDLDRRRYSFKHNLADKTTLTFIADNILQLLSSSYTYITSIAKNEIPFAAELKQ